MGKILAIIFLVLFAWVSYPHLTRGEWIAPTALPPGWWGLAQAPEYTYMSEPPQGYGWFRFDFWNNPPAASGRPVYKSDFKL